MIDDLFYLILFSFKDNYEKFKLTPELDGFSAILLRFSFKIGLDTVF